MSNIRFIVVTPKLPPNMVAGLDFYELDYESVLYEIYLTHTAHSEDDEDYYGIFETRARELGYSRTDSKYLTLMIFARDLYTYVAEQIRTHAILMVLVRSTLVSVELRNTQLIIVLDVEV